MIIVVAAWRVLVAVVDAALNQIKPGNRRVSSERATSSLVNVTRCVRQAGKLQVRVSIKVTFVEARVIMPSLFADFGSAMQYEEARRMFATLYRFQ